jgi:SAM-dependent methyltransferase
LTGLVNFAALLILNQPMADEKPSISDPTRTVWDQLPDWKDHYGIFQMQFSEMLRQEPALSGRVLDIGCGGRLHPTLAHIRTRCRQMDGVDPGAEVLTNPNLTMRWHAAFEQADIPPNTYDAAISYYVVEHIADPEKFLSAMHRVLKPGGIYWAMTPHRNHPFAQLSLLVQSVGLKPAVSNRVMGVNAYPAYYRLNSARALRTHVSRSGLHTANIHYLQAPGWFRGYMPMPFWVLPMAYETLLSRPLRSVRPIIAFQLQKQS